MNPEEYIKMFELEDCYWWFVARRQLVEELVASISFCELPRRRPDQAQSRCNGTQNVEPCSEVNQMRPKCIRILDAGCGTGANLRMLRRYGEGVGLDLSSQALRFSSVCAPGALSAGDLQNVGFSSSSFDLVTALDVLEHVRDDQAAVIELHRITKPGGRVIVTVPAYQFLWSEHDEALHHHRRYTRRDLISRLTAAGFQIERATYFLALFLIPIYLFRLARRFLVRRHREPLASYVALPPRLNRLLASIVGLERIVLRHTNIPFGVSILCVAVKPRQGPVARPQVSHGPIQRNDGQRAA
jgi:SAM-dependent methyltransferase